MPERERRIIELDRYITPTMPLPGDPREHEAVALKGYRDLVERYPDDTYVLYLAGYAQGVFGHWDRQAELYRRSFDADPGQCFVSGTLITALHRTGRGSEALAVARRAVAARPNTANLAQLALSLARTGAYDEAARRAREALGTRGSGLRGAFIAVRALAAAGVPEEAEAAARELARSSPTPSLARQSLELATWALGLQGRVKDAVRTWPGDDPKGPSSLDARGALLAIGHPRVAAAEALRRLREAPGSVLIAGELAFHGGEDAARTAASALQPGSAPHAYYQAVVLANERRWDEAIPALRKLLLRFGVKVLGLPDARTEIQLQVRLLMGEGLLEMGRPAEALEAMSSADDFEVCTADAAENLPRIWIARARALEQMTRPREATEILDRLLHQWRNADPGLPLLDEARTLRQRLAGQSTPSGGVSPSAPPAR
jgi:tetratricopeptide (TPR) repeat protein